jgi:hypothetical protein
MLQGRLHMSTLSKGLGNRLCAVHRGSAWNACYTGFTQHPSDPLFRQTRLGDPTAITYRIHRDRYDIQWLRARSLSTEPVARLSQSVYGLTALLHIKYNGMPKKGRREWGGVWTILLHRAIFRRTPQSPNREGINRRYCRSVLTSGIINEGLGCERERSFSTKGWLAQSELLTTSHVLGLGN